MDPAIAQALKTDRTIDIITTGAKSGLPRRTEIWFWNINGRIIICGTPDAKGAGGPPVRRDWLAIMSTPETRWYRQQDTTLADLVANSPIVEVFFLDG